MDQMAGILAVVTVSIALSFTTIRNHRVALSLCWNPIWFSIIGFASVDDKRQIRVEAFRVYSHSHHRPSLTESKMTTHRRSDSVEDPLVRLGLPSPLLLGSGSSTRKSILTEMNIALHRVVCPIHEKAPAFDHLRFNNDASELVLALANAKADALVRALTGQNDTASSLSEEQLMTLPRRPEGGWVVLTADQVVTHDNLILEKPESLDQARSFVSMYAEHSPRTVGAVVLTHIPSNVRVCGVDSATIVFRPTIATSGLIDRLVETKAPILDCAGGLMVEHPLVKEHVERIEGTEDGVMGLSKELVWKLLHDLKSKSLSSHHP